MSDIVGRLRDAHSFMGDPLLKEAAEEIDLLLANAKQDAEYLAAYHLWCQQHGCAPSSSDLITSRKGYVASRAALAGEKKDD